MTNLPSEPERATIEDLQTIVNLKKETVTWLQTKGTDQWAEPWPSESEQNDRIKRGLEERATWIVWHGSTPVATITAQPNGSSRLWTPEERRQPAVYLHRLIINRDYAGRRYGADLISWAERHAAQESGARTARIDVWTTNIALHDYYRGIGFGFLRYAECGDYPSSALFERPIDAADREFGDD
jgi:ribosomal protein S18 acetylase RimI-like enzyme